jgi:hypothetical protein
MILRPSTIVWMVVWVIAAFGLYMVKYQVQAIKVEVAATEKQLREEKKSLHVLTAEWTYLNRPERLKFLSSKYLDLKPVKGQQLADFASLPYDKSAPVQQTADDEEAGAGHWNLTLASGAAHGQ